MKCPYCKADNDKVVDSRSSDDGYSIRRRRMCAGCGRRYTTYERIAESDLRVVKKDGARELFSPEKVRHGIQRACWKRPIETDRVEQAITEIVQEIYDLGVTEIDSQTIGEMAMEKLVDLDDVAYIRFASVYRQFKDIHDFVAEVRPILDRNQLKVESSKK